MNEVDTLPVSASDTKIQLRKLARRKRRRRRIVILLVGIIVLLGLAWQMMISMPGTSYHGPLPHGDERLAALEKELRRDVAMLAGEIGERNVPDHPKQLSRAARYIEAQLASAGYALQRQSFDASGCLCSNIEVEITGRTKPKEIVVIGAHYDTREGTPGADDNSSGIAGLLALARRFARHKTDRTLRFVAFVNEEPPYFHTDKMGSRVYAKRCRSLQENVVAMMSLEMLGYYDDASGSQSYPTPFSWLYPSQGNFIGFIGNVESRELVRQAIGCFRRNEQFPSEGAAPAEWLAPGIGLSDQWSFWQEGYPALMVTDTARYRNPHYHQASDTLDTLDFDRMARVVRGVESAVAELAGDRDSLPDAQPSRDSRE
jgi:Zn-dependent M28 family amino/carboxypeptidase